MQTRRTCSWCHAENVLGPPPAFCGNCGHRADLPRTACDCPLCAEPRARVEIVDGQLCLVDPDAAAMARAVGKHNCRVTLDANRERIEHFRGRAAALGKSPADVVIVVLRVDDPNGGALADALMPGYDWQAIRDRGETPFARGLAGRGGIQAALDLIDPEAAGKLRAMAGLAVVVVDHGTAEVF